MKVANMDVIETIRSLEGRDCITLEKINNRTAVVHVIRNPDPSEPGFYRSAISREYFSKRELTRWHDKYYKKGIKCPRWFDMKTCFDSKHIEREIKFFEEEVPSKPQHELRDLPIVEHQSVWDFYTYIKYDYKKKKWL